jgi:hypothetical protein
LGSAYGEGEIVLMAMLPCRRGSGQGRERSSRPGGHAARLHARRYDGRDVSDAWDAYLSAEIRIDLPAGAIRVFPAPAMQASGRFPDPAGQPVAVLTAHNPGGVVAGPAANARAQALLEGELASRGRAWWPAAGADPSWSHVEDGVAVPGISEAEALELGARFGQEAIFVLTPGSRRVIECATGRRSVTGWVIVAEADLAGEGPAGQDMTDEGDRETEAALERLVGELGPDPLAWGACAGGAVLAESRWDPGGAAAGTPASGDFLVRVGGTYVIYQTDGADWEWDDLDAEDDVTAIERFRAHQGE